MTIMPILLGIAVAATAKAPRVDLVSSARVVEYKGDSPDTGKSVPLVRGTDGYEAWVGPDGQYTIGMTDTDDYFVAQDAKLPVAQLPIRVDGQTICIPNCVAIIRGSDNPESAKKLVDYLLSEEVELKLAASEARQIPLGPVTTAEVSPEVQQLADWASETADMTNLGQAQEDCLNWLKAEYAP